MSPNCGAPSGGTGGADSAPGTLGAPPIGALGAPPPTEVLPSIIGFSLSTVTAFFNRVPLRISPKRASRPTIGGLGMLAALVPPPSAGGGGGGGGGGGIAMVEGW